MSRDLDQLLSWLDLEAIETNIFRGQQPRLGLPHQRTFGGLVAGQALMAAGRTVEDRLVHSLHSYFLLPGDPSIPILYEVDRIRDGKSFVTRRVVAIQHGRAIFNLEASFHLPEHGLEHSATPPNVPAPESLPNILELIEPRREEFGWVFDRPHPIEQRFITEPTIMSREPRGPEQRIWIKADGSLPDDPLVHACVTTFASDMSLVDTIFGPHPMRWNDANMMAASIDHCMWFHDAPKIDEWMLYDMDTPIAHQGRGLARGFLFDASGALIVSMVQEGLCRVVG
jgi:acyl-CoA thioesterase II